MEEHSVGDAPPRAPVVGWIAATLVVCALFWGGLYLAWLQPVGDELARLRKAQAQAEQELSTAQAEQQLAQAERELADLEHRWEATTAAALARHLEAHSVTLLKAYPGKEAGTLVLEVEGSAHGLGLALPGLEAGAKDDRLPPVLYFQRAEINLRKRAQVRLEGVGRISDWTLAPTAGEK